MYVRDRMQGVPPNITLKTSMLVALRLVYVHQCPLLPVVNDEGLLIGIVPRHKLPYTTSCPSVRLSIFEHQYRLCTLRVKDILCEPLAVVTPATSSGEAARVMVEREATCLPVVDENGSLVGIINRWDLVSGSPERWIAKSMHKAQAVGTCDAFRGNGLIRE